MYSKYSSWAPKRLPRTEEANSIYSNPDDDLRGAWLPGDPYANKPYSKGQYTIKGPTGREFSPPPGRFWRVSEEKLRDLDADGRIWWGPTGNARPSIKKFLSEVADLVPRTLWKKDEVGSNRTSKNEIRKLFPETESFDTPKPLGLVERMLLLSTNPNSQDIILDFFAGSGTTGHAVVRRNYEDGGDRRYIIVQLPEPIPNDALRTIAHIARERLRRAMKEIQEKHPDYSGDLGFRTFALDTSNIRAWEPDPQDLEKTLFDNVDHIKEGRSEQDVLYELLLKLGLDLCVPIEKREIHLQESASSADRKSLTVYAIGGGVLIACLGEAITNAAVEPLALGIAAWRQELDPLGESTVVFRDSAFADDVAKTNLTAILQ